MSLFGTIVAISHSTVPTGYLLCNGSAVSRTTYSALFSAIGTLYGKGDGSSTFNLPNLVGRFLEGNSSAGTSKVAGLPNITGHYIPDRNGNNGNPLVWGVVGAYQTSWKNEQGHTVAGYSGSIDYKGEWWMTFDASRSNSTYGASSTVQPPSVTTLYCIKY